MSNIPKRYDIYCNNCEKVIGTIDLLGERVSYVNEDNLYSSRKRPDGNWGFECSACGHYTLVTADEVPDTLRRAPKMTEVRRTYLTETLAKRRTSVKQLANGIEVDGFKMIEVAR